MRYFKTTNASRQYFAAGGLVFTFEPTEQVGGGWHGVLAVEESAASSLAKLAETTPQLSEINAEQYADAKKKPRQQSTLVDSPMRPPAPPQTQAAAAPAARPAQATPSSTGVELKTTRAEPPLELVDEAPKPKRK